MPDRILSVVLVDDEWGSVHTLKAMFEKYTHGFKVAGVFTEPLLALKDLPALKPDILFLDVEMPQLNGFELLDKLAPVPFEVVFVTAFNSYAIRAIRYAAIDYILKPVNIDELNDSLLRVRQSILSKGTRKVDERIPGLLHNLKSGNDGKALITIPTPTGFEMEEVDSIVYAEAFGSYSKVYLRDERAATLSKNLKDLGEILPPDDFMRVHHSYLVNIHCVEALLKAKNGGRGASLKMKNGKEIEVSIRKKQDVMTRLSELKRDGKFF